MQKQVNVHNVMVNVCVFVLGSGSLVAVHVGSTASRTLVIGDGPTEQHTRKAIEVLNVGNLTARRSSTAN